MRGCDKLARRANQSKPVQPSAQKYSAFVLTQISRITPSVSRQMRGASRSSRTRGEMRWTLRARRRMRRKRTAKSCGSGAAVLALSSGEASFSRGDGGKRAVLRGEHEVSRKAIAQGRPECSRCPVCSCAVLFAQIARETAGAASTRSSLRPLNKGGKLIANLGRNAPRECEVVFSRSHVIASEARGRSPDERSDIRGHSHTVPDIASLIRATKLRQTASLPPARASGTAANPAAAKALASSPSIFPARRYPSPPRARRARPAPAVGAWRS